MDRRSATEQINLIGNGSPTQRVEYLQKQRTRTFVHSPIDKNLALKLRKSAIELNN